MSRTVRMKKAPWLWDIDEDDGTERYWDRCHWLRKGRTRNWLDKGRYDAKRKRKEEDKATCQMRA